MGRKTRKGFLTTSGTHLLHRASQCVDAEFTRTLREHGLTPRQYIVLVAIAEGTNRRQRDAVAATGIDRSTLSELLRRLARRGHIQRERRMDDTRAFALGLTDQGRALLARVADDARAVDERALNGFSSADRQLFLGTLRALCRRHPPSRIE